MDYCVCGVEVTVESGSAVLAEAGAWGGQTFTACSRIASCANKPCEL